MDLHDLPTLNACLNATAGILLFFGWRAIKKGKREVHQKFMIAALICSALFLCSYISYHLLKQGIVTHYTGEGIVRFIYPPTQKTTGLPVDECENKQIFCSGDVRPFLEKADRNPA